MGEAMLNSDVFYEIQMDIEKELSDMKKIVDNINQMRVEAAYLESDLMTTIDAATWENLSELIGLASMTILDMNDK